MDPINATASYAIDRGGTIVWADEGFAGLAREHGQPDLAERAVGRPLMDFIAGDRPRALQRVLIERALKRDEPLELRYRCDAPDLRRHAFIRIAAQPDDGVVFSTRFEAIEERSPVCLLDAGIERRDDVVQLCAWCNRINSGGWREVGDVDAAGTTPPRVEHSVCETCELLLG